MDIRFFCFRSLWYEFGIKQKNNQIKKPSTIFFNFFLDIDGRSETLTPRSTHPSTEDATIVHTLSMFPWEIHIGHINLSMLIRIFIHDKNDDQNITVTDQMPPSPLLSHGWKAKKFFCNESNF